MRHDETLLLDMLIAARKVQEFTQGIDQASFMAHSMLQSAVIREIQVIGEAARLISEATKAQHSAIDWRAISGMRNRVIHEYFNVDLDIVWTTIERDIPSLRDSLEQIVPGEEEG